MKTAIVWFRSELRLADNQALRAALARAERIVPVYVHAPGEAGRWPAGAASRWWLHQSLAALEAALAARGAPLSVHRGPSAATLVGLARALGADTVYWNRSYEPSLRARDADVERALAASGVRCETFGGALLAEPAGIATQGGTAFRVFTPFWRACQATLEAGGPPLAAPKAIPGLPGTAQGLALAALELLPRRDWAAGFATRFTPGEAGAQARLAQFLDESVADYAELRDRPDLAGSSRLSAHLHFGEVSPRQLLWAARSAALAPGASGRARGTDSFVRQLGWREFAHHVLHHFPDTSEQPLNASFASFPWRDEGALLAAWQRGETGIPLVDAGMRELWQTGWMHNRVRMVVASLLTKNLGLHWLDGARWFHDTLLDADLANNTLGWQWVAGCGADAAPYYRIFNPERQCERFDPKRAYLRRWLPELASLPDEWLHRPADAPARVLAAAGVVIGRSYPRPIVDLKASRERALAAYGALRAARPAADAATADGE
jgi:deoxyribodipyrimidine photo-lyase